VTDNGDPRVLARAIVLRRLSAAARSRADLAAALSRRGIPDDVAAEVLDEFEGVGLIDDAALADSLAESGVRHRGLQGSALRVALRRRGIPDDLARTAVGHCDSQVAAMTARRLVERRLAGLSRLDDAAATRRLVGFLVRRGHSPSAAHRIVTQVIQDRAVGALG
jgi:regulatory protein